jgi:hypothetical protein
MQHHTFCYNSCIAFGYLSESLPLPYSSFECYLCQYSSNIPHAASKQSSYNDNLLICLTSFGSPGAFWLAMDANIHGEGPSNVNNEGDNPHAETIDELYEESHEDGEIDPLDFNLPSEGDVHMEGAQVHNPRGDKWMKTDLIAAKNNEYSGEDVGDFSERSQLVVIYKYLVNEAIKFSHVPVEHHGYVARRFLKGKIENHVLLIAAKTPDKVLTKGNIFDNVEAGIQGTTPGLITL